MIKQNEIEKPTPAEEALIRLIEAALDEELRSTGAAGVIQREYDEKGATERVWRELALMYKEHGWKVDDDGVEFTVVANRATTAKRP